MLPGDPGFDETLMIPCPDYLDAANRDGDSYAFVVGEDGLARPVTSFELDEYIEGGEYDQRLIQIGEVENNY